MHLFTDEIDSVNDPDYEPVTSSTSSTSPEIRTIRIKKRRGNKKYMICVYRYIAMLYII